MKKLYISILVFLAAGFTTCQVFSQLCDPTTPQFIVNLAGQPNGVWISTPVVRQGYCCGLTSGPDKCLEFILTLDSSASSINFGIASGAIPPGALFYQINCGPPVQVGNPVCLNGPGPHILTFCKPGNNVNTYQITSIPKPSLSGSPWVSQQCPGQLNSAGLEDTSITWTSIPPNALYNSYLNCLIGCDTVMVTPTGTLPVYVDYQVCGTVIGGCMPGLFCDTIRVFFVNNLAVNITPQNPFVCFGSTTATVTANPTGGMTPYTYLWSNGATTQSITVGAGTYTIQMQDTLACIAVTDTVVISTLPAPISANAGIDQLFCTNQQSVNLNGTVNVASGGQWIGGNGTFTPNNTTLNATYTPTAGEIAAGTVQLMLVTTGNYSCPADTDVIVITISQSPVPSISGITSACVYLNAVYTAPLVSGINYSWSVSGGNIAATNNNSITVTWTTVGSGTVTLTETNAAGCDSTVMITVTINPQPTPVINGPDSVCTSTVSTYTVTPVAGNSYSWVVTGGTITGSSANSSVNVQWSSAGNGTITVTQSNSFGCDSTVMIPVKVLTIPTPVISGAQNVCQMQTVTYSTPLVAGNTYTWNVTGGNIVSTNNNSITINWPTAGSGTITLTQANTLICDSTVTLNVTIGPQPIPVINGPNTVCTSTTSTYAVATPVAGNSYNWVVTGGTITGSSTNSNVNVQWSTAGNGTITVTQSNSFGCDSTVMIPVVILTNPAPVISGIQNVCAMQTVTYSTPFVTGNTYTWNVTGGTIISTNNNSITINWPAAGSGTITLTQANTLTCDSTVTLNVTIGPQPIPVITGPDSVCTSTVSTYTVNPVAGNSYNWVVTGGTITGSSTNSSVNVQWSTAGNGTITVTQSNSFGCDSTVMIPVVIMAIPAPVISGVQNVCEMQTITYSTPFVAGNTYAWNVTGGTVISNNNNSITVNWPAAGSGTITLTQANTLICDSTVMINITIGPQPIPVINGPDSVCTSTISIYAVATPVAGNSYNWVVTGGSITGSSTNSNVNVQWSIAGNGTITVTQSNSFGCDSTVMIPVVVLTIPAPVISGIQNVCEMQTITYSTPFVAGNTYIWNVTGGNIISTNNNSITVNWPAAGSGTITLTQANTLICDSTVTLNVTIGPQPIPVINGPDSVCTSTTSTYAVVTPVAGNSYNWVVTGGTITGSSTNSNVNVLWSTAGNGTITVTQSNSFGCDSTVMIPVVILTIPGPVISGIQNVCEMQTITYSTPFVAGNTYTWNVTGGNIISTNNNSITINWPTAGSGIITLTQANTLICDSTVTLNITIGPQPIPVITGPVLICTSTNGQYSVVNPVAGNFYNWTVTGGTITGAANTDNINVLWNTAGTGMVTVTQSNSFGCDSTVSLAVSVKLKPAPVLNGTPLACELDTATYSVPFVTGHIYLWNVIGGSIIGLTVGSSIEVLWTTTGTGSVSLRQISPDGCDSTVSKSILINPIPAPVITGPAMICEDELATYNTSLVSGNLYNWSVSNGVIIGGSSSNSVNIIWTNAGVGNLNVIETNPEGCSNQATMPVQVLDKPEPLITGSGIGCISNSQNSYSVNNQAGVSYQWSSTGGVIVSGNGTTTVSIQWTTPGVNNITLTATNLSTGCDSTVMIPVLVDSLASPVVQATSLTGCAPVKMNFTGNVINPNYQYIWNFGDGTSVYGPNPYHQYTQPGTYNIQLIATNNTGCVDTATAQVIVHPYPTANFLMWYGSDPYYANMSILELENLSTGALLYSWNFGDGSTSTTFEPQYQYTLPGTYAITLVATNQWGCQSTMVKEIIVKVPEDLFVPNAFSPNDDAMNDYFSVGYQNIIDLNVAIFNRYGNKIYSSDDPDFHWDGTFKNQPMKQDVYIYQIRATGYHGKSFDLKGTVTLIR